MEKTQCCWMAITVLMTLASQAFAQDEFDSDDQRSRQLIFGSEELRVEDAPYVIEPDALFEPFFQAYYFLEDIDHMILDPVDYFLKDEILDMPDTTTPYRTHGGVI